MMNTKTTTIVEQWAVAALFAILTIGILYMFVSIAEPDERKPGRKFERSESYIAHEAQMMGALTEAGLRQRMEQIRVASYPAGAQRVGRFTGSEGFYQTERLIRDTFKQAGLQVVEQRFQVPVPVTEYCEVLDETGNPIPGVRVYPFEPAGMLPTALPPEGVTGPLLLTVSSGPLDLDRKSLEGTIVLNDGFDCSWPALASLGAKAVIVMDPKISLKRNPDALLNPWKNLTPTNDLSFPRFYAQGPLAQYAGKPITLRCKVTWQTKTVYNLIGLLRGGKASDTAREALCVTSYYDSYSAVPDLAPGGEQAISLAAMLEMATAIAPHRENMTRDVLFIAVAAHSQSLEGVSKLMEATAPFMKDIASYQSFDAQLQEEKRKLEYAQTGLEIVKSDDTWRTENAAFRDTWLTRDADFRKWFEARCVHVAGEIDLKRKEDVLTTRLAWMRKGKPAFRDGLDLSKMSNDERTKPENRHPLMQAFVDATTAESRAASILSVPFWQVAKQLNIVPPGGDKTLFEQWNVRGAMERHFDVLCAYHTDRIAELQTMKATQELFEQYATTFTLNLELYSGGVKEISSLSLQVGYPRPGTVVMPLSTDLRDAVVGNVPKNADGTPAFVVSSWGSLDTEGSDADKNLFKFASTRLESTVWYRCGRMAMTVMNKEFFPIKLGTPEDTFDRLPIGVVNRQLPPIAKTVLSIAHGNLAFKQIAYLRGLATFSGTIFTSAGLSPLPTHRVGDNTFVRMSGNLRPPNGSPATQVDRGIWQFPTIAVNPYGYYEKRLSAENFKWNKIDLDAFRFDEDGRVAYCKDNTLKGQSVMKNEQLPAENFGIEKPNPANIGIFRAAEVACYQRVNPKTMNVFPKFNVLLRQGMSEPEKSYSDSLTTFIAPDAEFYVGMMDGSAYNPDVQTYRAFMLNVDPSEPIGVEEPDIYGRGYLAADTPNLVFPYFDAAESMLRTNAKRLRQQQRFNMADAQMLKSHEAGKQLLEEAWKLRKQGESLLASTRAGRSLAYAINNHPVIRTKVSNAVVGIIWYLILLVPFVFFFEKLVFGFTDIRKQLMANGIIFVVVFLLLSFFHPAFHMVRSAVMILLGFIIVLLASVVTLMVTGRFQQTIRKLRRKEGYVEGADVSRGGVVGTAFMLGLNNMRRRKVRTGLTCVTLVLITFVMICFTSVSTDLVDVEYATGHSPCNGLYRRDPNFVPLKDAELDAFKQNYGMQYFVTSHRWLTGKLSATGFKNPDITVDRVMTVAGHVLNKQSTAHAAIVMEWNEPMFSHIDRYLKTTRGWFPRPFETEAEIRRARQQGLKPMPYAIISEEMMNELELTLDEVNTGHPLVVIATVEYEVIGVFDSAKLNEHVGMDGQSILPYDLNSVKNLSKTSTGELIVPRDIARLNAKDVIILSVMPSVLQSTEINLLVSCSVLFPTDKEYAVRSDLPTLPGVPISKQRELVAEYLEQIGTDAYYAIDGIAYYGRRTRAKTAQGLIELLIPILIASLTVFNTMRGSVYERKDEIYVYNAVGIAPNHIFFMFMAEALVYAVMGAMLGYLLSMATGTIMTLSHLSTGLNADYSAIETIYASLAIVASVLLSTLVPARTASRLALPSDEMRWTVPTAENDVMTFNLPFTFTPTDRIAIISYFYRWLDANGEGSSGSFYCSPPELLIQQSDKEVRSGGLIPAIGATIWLKPFDLGVSQRLTISLPTDPETGEYIANITIERLSGTTSAWMRTVMPFLTTLRKQFLNWRAVTEDERNEMFEEAKAFFTELQTRETVNV